MDRFLSMIAVDTLIWNWDGYANNKNNYRTFIDLDKNRVVLMPHGIDMTFSQPNAPIVTGRAGLVCKALLETDEGRQMYLARLREVRTNLFNVPAILKRVDELSARIEPVLAKDGTLSRQQNFLKWYRLLIMAREREVDAQLAGLKDLLHLERDAKVGITNWAPGTEIGGVVADKSTDAALHLNVTAATSAAAWNSTLWLEEGSYRLEARIKTRGVRSDGDGTNNGAGLRVWTARKASAGASWSWSPLQAARDPQIRGVIPVMTNTVQRRLVGDNDWTTIRHDFELRQPIADLQIQCVIENSTGEAWFDTSSLQIQRRSKIVAADPPKRPTPIRSP
jgi:hypothetical protein